jgi:RimJ/RimL family protein N-acetyltransferase
MLTLVSLDEVMLERLLRDPDAGLRALCTNGPDVKNFLLPALQQTRDFYRRSGSTPPWLGYLGIEPPGNPLVGLCGFKGNPNAAGEVEIAYVTVSGLEGRGYATAMARALVEIALGAPFVRQVIAHTLPENNASGRVLQKVGLVKVGEVLDPEDGKVWRWESTVPKACFATPLP